MMNSNLIKKYNVPGPRYTSYPTVPYWETESGFSREKWKSLVRESFDLSNSGEGISIYIHLPYCERLCTYCGCNTRITINHKVEEPYINTVLKEWEMYLKVLDGVPQIKELHLGGGTPTFFSPENLKKLMDGILEKAEVRPDAEFGFEAHPNSTSKAHLQALYDLGFRRLSLGIQDFDPKVQQVINRLQSYGQVKEVTENAREIGYTSINYDLIYGLPLQKIKSVEDTIEKVKLLAPDRIAFYSYAHVPWIKPGQRSYTDKDLPTNEYKRQLYELGKEMFLEAGYVEIGMDHFALKSDSLYKAQESKTLHRNFMGYTPNYSRLMIDLGVSSISDSWTGFAQNVKTVEGYTQKVEQGEIPVFRGHVLDEEDLVLRKHILNIMCHYETNWHEESRQVQAVYDAVDRLAEMEQDGLVMLKPFELEVTEKGKPFIRNICMAFDARLWRKQPETEIFSQTI